MDSNVKTVGEHQDGSPPPANSDVCAALKVLNETMEGPAKNMFKTFEQGAEQVGAIAGDLKRAISLVDQALKTFGQKDRQPSNTHNAASDVIVVDDDDVVEGKNITIPVARDEKEVYIPEKPADQPAGDIVPFMEPLLHSGILGNWNEDTIILGSIIHQDQTRMFNRSGAGENTNATNQWQHLENHTGISMQCFKCSSFTQRIRTEHDRMATGKPILFVNNSILS
ncbi:hypothetical protein Ahy_A01g000366 [Arachis hypogaea]|uniref:Uncharacterized protein n=1 Tax=Arachis hypogaea TaxID=3818 RepID=A0A445EK82_ARAHY|nr:hypothetical protein Ahy_A01g000366 [Arachis hypogaea]